MKRSEEATASEAAEGERMESVNHPQHYKGGKYECIDVMVEVFGIEYVKGFCLCNAFKYLWRCKQKHENPDVDIKKAIWYLERYLSMGAS